MRRLEREGRIDAFYKRRSELYHDPNLTWKHWDHTWWPVAREFGFESKRDELERFEDFMLHGSRTKMQEELREMQEDIKRERAEQELDEVLAELGDASALDLPADIAWVYNHPAMWRKPGDDGCVSLTLKDMQGAPGRGAVGMLQYFCNKRADFYKLVLSHLAKKNTQGAEDETLGDDLRSVDEITAMLAGQ